MTKRREEKEKKYSLPNGESWNVSWQTPPCPAVINVLQVSSFLLTPCLSPA